MNTRKALWIVVALCGCVWAQTAPAQTQYVQVVEQEPTTLSLTASAQPLVGAPVTFTATVSPIATGSVSFSLSSNSIPMQQVQMAPDGEAQWTITFPSPGTYTILAQYAGDNNHGKSSAVITENVSWPGAPDFTISVDPAGAISPGQTWLSAVHLKAINGFAGKVTLSCGTGMDSTMKCNFAPVSLVPDSKGSDVQLTISTVAATIAVSSGALLPIIAWWPFGDLKRRRQKAAFLLLILCIGLAGCATSDHFTQSAGTPPGTYHIDITGTSGAISHTAEATVVVK